MFNSLPAQCPDPPMPHRPRLHRLTAVLLCASTMTMAPWATAHPSGASSDLSLASALPVAVSVTAPVMVLAAGIRLTVVAVQASTQGTVWVLERASDGVRMSLQLAGEASATVGTVVVVTALSTGWVLSAAGQALCFIPNESGAALLYHEQVTR